MKCCLCKRYNGNQCPSCALGILHDSLGSLTAEETRNILNEIIYLGASERGKGPKTWVEFFEDIKKRESD